jgi:endonuclease-3
LAHAFGINAGVTVDTHVKRLCYRLGMTDHTDPVRVERDLMRLLPQPDWENWSIRLIYHGRAVCDARKPACDRCELADLCPQRDPPDSNKPLANQPKRSTKSTAKAPKR